MSMKVQKIGNGSKGAVIVPEKTWKNFVSALEDLVDTVAYDRAKRNDDGTRFSMEDIEKIIQRKNRAKPRRVSASRRVILTDA